LRDRASLLRVHEMALKSKKFSDLDVPVSALYLLAAPEGRRGHGLSLTPNHGTTNRGSAGRVPPQPSNVGSATRRPCLDGAC
jgi:hypothetical protein